METTIMGYMGFGVLGLESVNGSRTSLKTEKQTQNTHTHTKQVTNNRISTKPLISQSSSKEEKFRKTSRQKIHTRLVHHRDFRVEIKFYPHHSDLQSYSYPSTSVNEILYWKSPQQNEDSSKYTCSSYWFLFGIPQNTPL